MTSPIELLVYPTRDGRWRARVTGSVGGRETELHGPTRATPERAASDALADWRAVWTTEARRAEWDAMPEERRSAFVALVRRAFRD